MALSVARDNMFSNIKEINCDKASWNVKAKIIRMWNVSDFNRPSVPFSIEIVLMDDNRDRIHVSVRKTLIYKFKDDLMEGNVYAFENLGVATNGGAYRTTRHPYKLTFQFSSVVQRLANVHILQSPFNFVSIAEVVGGIYDTDFLVDVIGFLTQVGQEREITNTNGTTTKMNVMTLEADGGRIQCTLFGQYVDQLNTFMAAGETENAVVIVQLAKAKIFQDKLHIQNCVNCSVVIFNPTCPEAVNLRASLDGSNESQSPVTITQLSVEPRVPPIEEFLYNTPRITMQGLRDTRADSLHVVLATVKRILNPDSFWYTACTCSKAVIPDSNMFFCEKCNRHVQKVVPRFCLKVRVMDHTDSATFVIFDKEASLILNMSAADMIQGADPAPNVRSQLEGLVENSWLFKVEAKASHNPRFEQSFRVRKICNDEAIIGQFKEKWDNEEAVLGKIRNENGSLSCLLLKGTNVLVGGSSHVLSEDCQSLSESSEKGKELVIESTPVSQDLMKKFGSADANLDDDYVDTVIIGKQSVSNMNRSSVVAAAVEVSSSANSVASAAVGVSSSTNSIPAAAAVDVSSSANSVAAHIAVPSSSNGIKFGLRKKTIARRLAPHVEEEEEDDDVDVSTPIDVSSSGRSIKCGQGKNVGPKRLSPQQEVGEENDNVPIKLLKRPIKIEKNP